MAAALVFLVAVDTGITGWLLAHHFAARRMLADLGGIVQANSHDIEAICVQLGTVDDG